MSDRIVPNPATLVKYSNPTVSLPEKPALRVGEWTKRELPITVGGFPEDAYVPGLIPGASIRCEDASATLTKTELEDVLNIILPPRIWEEDGISWKQKVDTSSATRVDVLSLQEQLTIRLKQRQAKDRGICPVRKELFSQCFDELIRQVTINCVERGLLLVRIRDEIRMTLDAHRSLYESSTAYGTKKEALVDIDKIAEGKSNLENKIDQVNSEKESLEIRIQGLKIKMEQMEKLFAEQAEAAEKIFQEECDFLKRANAQLHAQLDGIMQVDKATEEPSKMTLVQKSLKSSIPAPSVVAPSIAAPSVKQPSIVAPSVNAPPAKSPSLVTPSVKSPAIVAPSINAPSIKAPSSMTPAVKTP